MKKTWSLIELREFSTNLCHLLMSGLSLLEALAILENKFTNKNQVYLSKSLKQKISHGDTFAAAWQNLTQEKLSSALLFSGESSGLLNEMLQHISTYAKSQQELRHIIWQAIRYPLFLLTLTFALILFLSNWLVPQFANLYQDFSVSLPSITKIILRLSFCVQHYFLILIAIPFLIFLISLSRYGKKFLQKLKLRIKLYREFESVNFWHAVSLLLNAGIPILQTLKICRGILQNENYQREIDRVIRQIQRGTTLHFAIKNTTITSITLTTIISISEVSGQLALLLKTYSAQEILRLREKIQTLKVWLEPIFLCIIGSFIGVILIALYLPMIELGQWV